MNTLQQLRARRATLVDQLDASLTTRQAARDAFDAATPTDEARAAHQAAESAFGEDFTNREADITGLDQRIAEQEALERARTVAAAASRGEGRVTAEPKTYRRDNGHNISYFRDLATADPKIGAELGGDRRAAEERLANHAKDTAEWMERRNVERERRANEQIERAEREHHLSRGLQARGFDASPFEQRVNPSRTPGQGGTFVPPLWLIEDFIPALRAGRVAADLTRQMELPEGTDSINIPSVATGSLVGVQGQDNAAVASRDMTDASVQANVKTLAGQQDVAIQLVEQSPGQVFDQVVMADLMADYNLRVDEQILVGNGTNSASVNGGQLLGLYPRPNWGANQVTWTSGTPQGNAFNMVMGAMASKTSYSRFDLTNFNFLMHPRRWFWFATALDGPSGTSGRPLVNQPSVAYNTAAVAADLEYPAQGHVGRSPLGPDVFIDGNVPINDNGGGVRTGALDVSFGAKWDDLWLFEGNLRTRVLPEVLSGSLQVRFQVYNYVAFLVRYGPSITLAQGTGFVQPVSAIDSSVVF
jgi:HK97 family phage major capsid protein